ncbi:MAG: CsgG/HfaB family protein [Thermodesulfobacteriota bacterium]|nr:CsgG/HfaB family protein [Thermodesulfobacteriota bacterium]
MKFRNLFVLIITLTVFLSAGIQASATTRTMAILPFENNSITDAQKYNPLCNGLSVMLMTELSNISTEAFKLIEREKIRALLDEIALGQTGTIDPSTAARIGKLLGAQSIGFGAFMVLGKQVRIDLRIIQVETGELIMAESITGDTEDFLSLEHDLARKIAKTMDTKLTEAASPSKSSIDAALLFARGVDALEKGDKTEAKKFFKRAVALDPAYQVKMDQLMQ